MSSPRQSLGSEGKKTQDQTLWYSNPRYWVKDEKPEQELE